MGREDSPVISVDVMGGDHAPDVVVEGIERSLFADKDVHILAVGEGSLVDRLAKTHDRVESVPTTEVIEMDEHPAAAVRAKKDSSIVVGCRLVREGRADGFFSAGSTGACMAAATLNIGRIKGVARPAIAGVMPTPGSPTVFLDIGANADCKPEHLLQFAHMGAAYARIVLGVSSPRIALLNIGAEETKGSMLTQEAYALMQEQVPGFIGNIEGHDLPEGAADVVVTDGFTGNVALKLIEGLSTTLISQVQDVLVSSMLTRVCALPMRSGLRAMKARLDPEVYGGAPLLGIDGVCIIGHGSSSATAVSNGIQVAADAVRKGLITATREALQA